MGAYELRITRRAAKELDAIDGAKTRNAVIAKIAALRDEPRPPGCTKLSGIGGLYRLRQGRLRIVYAIEDDQLVVVVIRVADRRDVYRGGWSKGGASRSFDGGN